MARRFGRRPFFPHVNRSPALRAERVRADTASTVHKRLLDLLEADIYVYEETLRRIEKGFG